MIYSGLFLQKHSNLEKPFHVLYIHLEITNENTKAHKVAPQWQN